MKINKKFRVGARQKQKQRQKQRGGKQAHKCGEIYSAIIGGLLWPFKMFKQFLQTIGVTTYIEDITKENRDYVLLFHIVMFMTVIGLGYFIFRKMFGGSLGVDLAYISNFLRTMDSFDLPMMESINAKAEREALDCWSSYFTANPLSFNNSGLFDIVRSVVLLPFVAIMLFLLPVFTLIYVIWFIWHFSGYIVKAIVGLVKAALGYLTEYVVCKITSPLSDVFSEIPFAPDLMRVDCPDMAEAFTGWREEYIDQPVKIESLKYFKIWYKNKWNYWDRAMLYLEKFWKRGRVQNNYNNKFLTRSKEVFYEKALDLNHKIDQNVISKTLDKASVKLPSISLPTSLPTATATAISNGLKTAGKSAVNAYKKRHMVYGVLSLLTLLTIVVILASYALTGNPSSIYEYLGPLWRSKDLGSRLQLLSSRYNWLGIIALTLLLIYLIVGGAAP